MDFEVSTEKFKKAVSCAARATSTKVIQPILNNVLLSTEKGTLQVLATDLDISIECKIDASVSKPGKITLPAKKMEEIAGRVEGDVLNVTIDKNQLAKIVSGKAKFQLNGVEASDFPEANKKEISKDVYKVNREELLIALSLTSFSVSRFETTSILSGESFMVDGKKFELGATDGSRLARYIGELRGVEKKEKISFVLPLRAVQELERLCNSFKEGNEEISFYIEQGQAVFYSNDFQLCARLMSGSFPEYDKLIPKKNNNKLKIKTNNLLKALDRVSILSSERTNVVKINLYKGKDKLKIEAKSPDYGNATDEVEVEYSGEDLEIAFNYKYLLEALRNVKEDEISLEMDSSLSPILLKMERDLNYDYTYLIMPVQLR